MCKPSYGGDRGMSARAGRALPIEAVGEREPALAAERWFGPLSAHIGVIWSPVGRPSKCRLAGQGVLIPGRSFVPIFAVSP